MKILSGGLLMALLLSACTLASEATPAYLTPSGKMPAPTATAESLMTAPPDADGGDFFAQAGISLPLPACDGTPTPRQAEGPYYKSDSPARNSLIEGDLRGERLILVGYVLDQNCQPIPNAWLDFWQADANGVYDNAGYTLRGYQFSDDQGRYYLETIVPGIYPGRTEHIHVKVRAPDGVVLTTQLYFPAGAGNAQDRLYNPCTLLEVEEQAGYLLGVYHFIIERE